MDDEFGNAADLLALTSASAAGPASAAAPTTTTTTLSAQKRVTQPTPQTLPSRSGPSSILVSPRQKGNPVLTHIHSLPWEYSDTPADYVLGATTCALFLSLKYHRLHPEYVYARMRALGQRYNLRVLLAMVDIANHEEPLRELAKTSLVNNLTLVLAWSAREAARYLEAFKALEFAAPTAIRGQQAAGYAERMVEFVTVPRGINKADAVGLVSAFGSVRAAVNAGPEQIASVQGWGEVKVKRWTEAVREPFRVTRAGKSRITDAVEGRMRAEPQLVSRVSNPLSRQATTGEEEQDVGTATKPAEASRPRLHITEWLPDDDEDDEAALLALQELENEHAQVQQQAQAPPAKRARVEAPELSDSMKAALAKYRD